MSVFLKTVAGRQTGLSADHASYNALFRAAVVELKLDQSSVKLLFHGKQLKPPGNIDIDGWEYLADAYGITEGAEVIAVGVRSEFLTPSAARSVKSERATPIPQSLQGADGPLSKALVAGLDEAAIILKQGRKQLAEFRQHSTVAAIREIVLPNPGALSTIMRQANESCPDFVKQVANHPQEFLDALNNQPVERELTVGELEGLLDEDGARVIMALQSLFQGGADVVEIEFEEGTGHSSEKNDEVTVETLKKELEEATDATDLVGVVSSHSRLADVIAQLPDFDQCVDLQKEVERHHLEACAKALEMAHQATQSASAENYSVAVALSFSPTVFAEAQEFLIEQSEVEKAFRVAVQHHVFISMLMQPTEHHGTVDEIMDVLQRYSARESAGIVLYETSNLDTITSAFTLTEGNKVRHEALKVGKETIPSAVSILQLSVAKQQSGINTSMIWKERSVQLYQELIQPVQQHFPPLPVEMHDEASTVTFIFPHYLFSDPVPLSTLLDENFVPLIAKWGISQSSSVTRVVEAIQLSEVENVSACVFAEAPPAWLTRHLKKMLNAEVSHSTQRTEMSILHSEPDKNPINRSASLIVFESYSPSVWKNLNNFRHKAIFCKILETDSSAPYELFRHFYLALTNGSSIGNAARVAMLECSRCHIDEPWLWGCFALLNFGGKLPRLTEYAQEVKHSFKMVQGERQRNVIKSVKSTQQYQYLESHGVHHVFDRMLKTLLENKPAGEAMVIDDLLQLLEAEGSRLSQSVAAAKPNTREGE